MLCAVSWQRLFVRDFLLIQRRTVPKGGQMQYNYVLTIQQEGGRGTCEILVKSNIHLQGIVVSAKEDGKFVEFQLDDSTDVVRCILWKGPGVFLPGPLFRWLGRTLSVWGEWNEYRQKKQVKVKKLAFVDDPNKQMSAWTLKVMEQYACLLRPVLAAEELRRQRQTNGDRVEGVLKRCKAKQERRGGWTAAGLCVEEGADGTEASEGIALDVDSLGKANQEDSDLELEEESDGGEEVVMGLSGFPSCAPAWSRWRNAAFRETAETAEGREWAKTMDGNLIQSVEKQETEKERERLQEAGEDREGWRKEEDEKPMQSGGGDCKGGGESRCLDKMRADGLEGEWDDHLFAGPSLKASAGHSLIAPQQQKVSAVQSHTGGGADGVVLRTIETCDRDGLFRRVSTQMEAGMLADGLGEDESARSSHSRLVEDSRESHLSHAVREDAMRKAQEVRNVKKPLWMHSSQIGSQT
uniref:OB domain-containing protein n=1 Tax=Chromera velia CCMP2878 TaxID=1169474 RepID=A0A0G4F683_9ALVE|eukprot:Cvel_15256.t1-p1 / transcript=Cvel_15256.t1 / gene=Cvel_15256 / organism=Chromera_velia_CCMP2878 / gene_product=hypothetical protein / transcript_product=hypothetical protein / location=Cvel_scaffold1118:18358-22192(-) / protein_length=466 / sequence_SO=supercontig / SO=protein_coding / is_pseudo=false